MDIFWTICGVAVLALMGWSWVQAGRRASDEMFEGLPPGLTPAGGSAGTRVPVKGGEYTGEIAVAFNPPTGVRPGLGGTVVDGLPEARHAMATIVDLGARGYLRLTIVEAVGTRTGKDWELTATDAPRDGSLDDHEYRLLQGLFRDGSPVRLSSLPMAGNPSVTDHRTDLENETMRRGWFRPVEGRSPALLLWVAALIALVLAMVTASWAGAAVAALAAFGAMLVARRGGRQHVRTAEGTAVRIQTLAFKKYLETAEKEQFSYEEAAGIFSKYLPWAIALGVASHWVKIFGELAAQAQADGYVDDFDLMWLGVAGWGMHDAMFSLAMFSAMDGFGDMDGIDGLADAFGDPGSLFDAGGVDAIGSEAGAFDGGTLGDGDSGGGWFDGFGGGDGGGFGDFGGGFGE